MPAFAKEKFRRNDFVDEVLNSYGRRNMDSLLRIFPQKRRAFWQKTADNGEKICEIRLRVDRPVIVETSRGDFFLNNGGEWQEHPYGAHLVTEAEIRELIAWLCQDSVYAYADEIRQGFLTVEGGHRIGLCGQAVLENETVIRTLKNIASINIRVAHEIRGAADGILPKLYKEGKLQNTLIVSPPGFGKTTLLRDLIRQISEIFAIYDYKTEIIAASIRNPIHVTDCALAGAHIATVPYKVIEQMTKHPLTDQGIEKFQADYKAVFGE